MQKFLCKLNEFHNLLIIIKKKYNHSIYTIMNVFLIVKLHQHQISVF